MIYCVEALCSPAACTRVLAQVELDFNSVERIVEYLEVLQEAPTVVQDKRPPAAWANERRGARCAGPCGEVCTTFACCIEGFVVPCEADGEDRSGDHIPLVLSTRKTG